MTAHQIATLIKLTHAAYDRGEFEIETLSSTVRALKAFAESQGILDEVNQIRRGDYEAPANG
jgi:hypothetical protein